MRKILLSMAALSALAAAAPAAAQYSGSYDYRYNPDQQIGQLQTRFDADVRRGTISGYDVQQLRTQLWQLRRLSARYGYSGLTRWERDDLSRRIAAVRDRLYAAENSGRYGNRGTERGNGYDYDRGYQDNRGYDDNSRYNDTGRYNDNSGYDDRGGSYDDGDDYRDNATPGPGPNAPYYDPTGSDDRSYDRDDQGAYDRETSGAATAGLGVGDRAPANLSAVPSQYRDLYPDGSLVYYRSDGGRIYQIDRATGTIRWVGDLPY